MFVLEKDYNSAVQILSAGVEFANYVNAYYTRMLFLLSKTMLFLLERKLYLLKLYQLQMLLVLL